MSKRVDPTCPALFQTPWSPRPARTVAGWLVLASLLALASSLSAQPTIVPVAEGQVGEPPIFITRVFGVGFLPLAPLGTEWLVARRSKIALPGQNSDVVFETDTVHDDEPPATSPMRRLVDDTILGGGDDSDSEREECDSSVLSIDVQRGILAPPRVSVCGLHKRGTTPDRIRFEVRAFGPDGTLQSTFTTLDIVSVLPDAALVDSDVTVDRLGRITLVYTEFDGSLPMVYGQRIDSETGLAIGGRFLIGPGFDPEIDTLDLDGDRLFVAYSQSPAVVANIIDVSAESPLGPPPMVGPPFLVNSTFALAIERPAVATDANTGVAAVAWDDIADNPGDPVNVRMRRFDALGNPVGNDFLVNVVITNAQAQPSMEFGPNGELAIAFTGAGITVFDGLDVFVRVYDASGIPIGDDIAVNTITADVQDRPTVRFLPELDSEGRPQFAVAWRDVGAADGSDPRGSGMSYRCFAIDGLPAAGLPFADGFESGDTSAWSQTVP